MAEPLISVVMPVHNAFPYIGASIQSILEQTFSDFELVVLDDASTDGSAGVIEDWAHKDKRIRFFQNKEKLGLRSSSNQVVSHSRAAVVARMDGDDISLPERLRRQWEVFRSNDDAVLVGTLSAGIDAGGTLVRPRDRWRLIRRSDYAPFPHGSIMFRRRAFDEVGGYPWGWEVWEDQGLFVRLSRKGRVLVIPDVLYQYRYHVNCASLTVPLEEVERMSRAHRRELAATRPNGDDRDVETRAVVNSSSRKASLQVLYTTGALRLWAGQSPAVLQQVLTRNVLRPDFASLQMLIWSAWGEISPKSLRMLLRLFIQFRDLLASVIVKNGRPYEWLFEQS